MPTIKFKRIPLDDETDPDDYIYRCKLCKQEMRYTAIDKHALSHHGTSVMIDITEDAKHVDKESNEEGR